MARDPAFCAGIVEIRGIRTISTAAFSENGPELCVVRSGSRKERMFTFCSGIRENRELIKSRK